MASIALAYLYSCSASCLFLNYYVHTGKPSITNTSGDKELSIVSGNEELILTCIVNGDDITGAYWERTNGSQHSNTSSLSNDTLTITISKARPTHSGRYRCVVYSHWVVAQSRNVQVNITSKSNNVLM